MPQIGAFSAPDWGALELIRSQTRWGMPLRRRFCPKRDAIRSLFDAPDLGLLQADNLPAGLVTIIELGTFLGIGDLERGLQLTLPLEAEAKVIPLQPRFQRPNGSFTHPQPKETHDERSQSQS